MERNPDDVWAVHAVAHTYEMRGRVDDGIRFLRGREADWGADNFFAVHNWWHLALFLLEAGRPADALAIYDTRIHHAGSEGVALELVDASALLWRLHLDGTDTGGRWAPLADAWVEHGCERSWYAFNDLHAVMALSARAAWPRPALSSTASPPTPPPVTTRSVPTSHDRRHRPAGLPSCRGLHGRAPP